jgi:hypothetical protein
MMNQQTLDTLQVIWEQLNGALYDITDGVPADAANAIEDCIIRLEVMGINGNNETTS